MRFTGPYDPQTIVEKIKGENPEAVTRMEEPKPKQRRTKTMTDYRRRDQRPKPVLPTLDSAMTPPVKRWCQANGVTTVEALKGAISSGVLHYKTVHGLGRAIYIRLCAALEIVPVQLTLNVEQQRVAQYREYLETRGYTVTKNEGKDL